MSGDFRRSSASLSRIQEDSRDDTAANETREALDKALGGSKGRHINLKLVKQVDKNPSAKLSPVNSIKENIQRKKSQLSSITYMTDSEYDSNQLNIRKASPVS